MWPARAHIALCTRVGNSKGKRSSVQIFFFSERKRNTKIYFSVFFLRVFGWNTCSFYWFRTRSYLDNCTQASKKLTQNGLTTSALVSLLLLILLSFFFRIESLTRHIYYSISAVKGDGALATTKLVVHQRGGAAGPLIYV